MDDLHRSRMCCDDFSPMLTEFVRQFHELTNVRFEAREKRFISALFPQAFESRDL
jgi:hypothetical protein